ncbi:TPA: hypothetical protein ACY4RS_000306 [Clostridium perfringens]
MINIFSLGIAMGVGIPLGNWIYNNTFNFEYKERKSVLKKLDYLFEEKNFKNTDGAKPEVIEICITNYGYYITLKIDGIVTYSEFENLKEYISGLFKAYYIDFKSIRGDLLSIDIVNKNIKDLEYIYLDLEPTKLLIGYDLKGSPLILDMLKTPHVGVVGTSINGKSKCIEVALKNLRGADITLVNTFHKDFRSIKADRVNGDNEILSFLKRVAANKVIRPRPYYIVIDEWNVLSNIKGMDKAIQDLLSQARHFNIYVIVIMQKGNTEDCKFKQLFNCRIAFRTIEEGTLRAFLGVSVGNGALEQREFYLLHTRLEKGRTYTIEDA